MADTGVDCETNVKQRRKMPCPRCAEEGIDGVLDAYLLGQAIPTVRRCSRCLGKGVVVVQGGGGADLQVQATSLKPIPKSDKFFRNRVSE